MLGQPIWSVEVSGIHASAMGALRRRCYSDLSVRQITCYLEELIIQLRLVIRSPLLAVVA
jgi:hypothetical protein